MDSRFFQIKINTFKLRDTSYSVMQIIEITSKIQYQKLIGEKSLLQMVNACVSHELRNPLNALMCHTIMIIESVKLLFDVIDNPNLTKVKKLKKNVRKILVGIEKST